MGQRSRKRGRRELASADSRSAAAPRGPAGERDAAVRATLEPLAPGERPWAIKVGAVVALLIGGVQLVLFLLNVKLKVAGTQPKAGSTVLFGVLMFICAVGVWLLRYWAVLGLMALLGIMVMYFSLALIKASSLLGAAIALVGIAGAGLLFYKLVRTLSRIQMPKYPGR